MAKKKPEADQQEGQPKKHAGGRPSIFTQELADEICKRLTLGESLRKICEDDHMPWRQTVMYWLIDENKSQFYDQYNKARNAYLDVMAEDIIDIADTPHIGVKTKIDDTGKTEETRGDMIEHRRLRVDARKWYLSKLAPKKYGDKVNLEHTGPDGGAVKVDISETERARRIAFALQRGLNAAKNGGGE